MSAGEWLRRLCTDYWLRVAGVCLAAALVSTALITALGRTSSMSVTLQHALIHAGSMGVLVGGALPRIHRRLRALGAMGRWALTVPVLLVLAIGGTLLACGLITLLALTDRPFWACFTDDLRIDALLTLTLGVGMTLYEAQRARLDAVTVELRTQELEHERARKLALQARLSSLESRLQPHFLFNTLNAISALIQEDPDQAERTVERLAALLRFSLDATERGMVPLAHELKIVADYLEIERTRLGDRLSYRLELQPEASEREIPALSIQTLVENSIKHAIAPRPGGGRLRIEAGAAGDAVIVTVWDDGPGFTTAAIRPGHGLDILQARLTGHFGAAATVDVARHDGGTRVTLTLPRPERRAR